MGTGQVFYGAAEDTQNAMGRTEEEEDPKSSVLARLADD